MNLLAALVLGFAGSFHCVAMCGAIALSLRSGMGLRMLLRQLFYNSGRLISYVFIVAILSSFQLVGVLSTGQNVISIFIGSVLFISSILMLSNIDLTQFMQSRVGAAFGKLRSVILKGKMNGGLRSAFTVGIVNGFLPCGFVYIALAAALLQNGMLASMSFMAFFALGTMPAMLGLVYLSRLPAITQIFTSRKVQAIATACVALLLVVRGLALGIPYISPSLPTDVQVLSDIRHEKVCGSPQTP